MGSFTDDPNTIAKECVVMFKHLGATVSDIRGMGIQVSKLSKDERASSSSTKTIHDFMKPFTTTTSNLNKCKEQQEAVTSGLQSSSCFPTVTKLPSGSDVTSDGVTKLDDGECRRESPMPINHSHPGIGTPSILRVSDTVSIETNSEAQGQELTEVTLAEKTHKDPEVVLTNDNDEFNLVLSDEELDVPALDVCQQNTKHELHAPTCNTTHQGPNEDRVTPLVDNTADSKADFPPLPVFPIFTPPRSSSTSSPSRRNHSKVSPARSSRGSLAGLAQGSPARSNKSSPGRFNKSSPGPSSKTSSRRSPVRPSAQRSLHTVFQSPRSNDVVTSMSLPSPSQIDPAVFEALPDEIQKDIENSYQQKNQRFTLRSSGSANVATQDEVQVNCPLNDARFSLHMS